MFAIMCVKICVPKVLIMSELRTHFQEQTQRSNSLLCQISDRYYFEFLDLLIP